MAIKRLEMKQGWACLEEMQVSARGDIEGYGSVFGNIDQGNDVVEPGAFAASLGTRGMPKMLWSHGWFDPPIGKWNTAEEDDRGLFLKGRLNLDTQLGAEVHSNLKMGTLDGLSIGYIPTEVEIDQDNVQHLIEVDLFEVSPVNFPMNELARVDAVKARIEAGISKRELESILRDAGMTRAQAKRLLADGFTGLIARDADESTESDQLKELVARLCK